MSSLCCRLQAGGPLAPDVSLPLSRPRGSLRKSEWRSLARATNERARSPRLRKFKVEPRAPRERRASDDLFACALAIKAEPALLFALGSRASRHRKRPRLFRPGAGTPEPSFRRSFFHGGGPSRDLNNDAGERLNFKEAPGFTLSCRGARSRALLFLPPAAPLFPQGRKPGSLLFTRLINFRAQRASD